MHIRHLVQTWCSFHKSLPSTGNRKIVNCILSSIPGVAKDTKIPGMAFFVPWQKAVVIQVFGVALLITLGSLLAVATLQYTCIWLLLMCALSTLLRTLCSKLNHPFALRLRVICGLHVLCELRTAHTYKCIRCNTFCAG